ncbi:MAG: DUF3040 domain-containing protein [Ancrocorticia sp.]|uniref:DUF3040 domain-containing protein n=1 Tax=Ancrocorticia sp. TaxID=2593684 RepID=UPI003F93CE10
MALSDYERKMLEELEAQLADEDPKFADTLKPEPPEPSTPMRLSIRHLVLGLLVAVVGIAVLVVGIAFEIVIVGVAGVVIMFGGFWYITEGFQPGPVSSSHQGKKPRPSSDGGFMSRQADQWQKRRGGNR